MIPESTVQKIFNTAQIEEVVGDFVNLKRSGKNLKGLCPFHDEKTPSFTVAPHLNIYKCFGCQKGGNPVQFIMEHEKVSFPEALRFLAAKYNIIIEEREMSPEEKEERQIIDSLYILNEHVAKFYHEQLFTTSVGKSVGLSYFKQRGFNESTLKKFQIGYAPASGFALKEDLEQNSYEVEYAKKLGLINTYDKDFFKDRVMFPIQNISGKVIAFAGRTLRSGKKIPKYINSPESEIYEKRKVLYGLYQAKDSVRKEEECILVEGYTDVMSLHQAGIDNVVATSGTALTSDQVRLIKRFANEVTVLYDGDKAGISAAMRGLRIILAQDMSVKVVMLPEGEDPDSFVQAKGKAATLEFLQNEKKDFILFQLEHLTEDARNDPMKRAKAIKTIVQTLAYVPDPISRTTYLQECTRLLNVSEEILIQELNSAIRQKEEEESRERASENRRKERSIRSDQGKPQPRAATVPSQDDIREREIVRVLIQHGNKIMEDEDEASYSVAEYVLSSIEDVQSSFLNDTYQRIIDIYLNAFEKGEQADHKMFLQHADEKIQQTAINFLTEAYDYSHNWEDKLKAPLRTQEMPEENYYTDTFLAVNHFKQKKIEEMIKQNQDKLSTHFKNDDEEGVNKCLAVQKHLIEIRKEVNEHLRRVVL